MTPTSLTLHDGATVAVPLGEILRGPTRPGAVGHSIVVKAWRRVRDRACRRATALGRRAQIVAPRIDWSEETDETIDHRTMSVASGWVFPLPYS